MRRAIIVIVVLATLLVNVGFPTPLIAKAKWNSFLGGESCTNAVSIDGNIAAFTNEHTGELSYYDFNSKTRTDIGLTGSNPSVSQGLIAFQDYGWNAQHQVFVYDISTGQVTTTPISTAKSLWGWTQIPGRYFTGQHIAFVDAVDSHVKYYALGDGVITDTGEVGDWLTMPMMDGNVIAFAASGFVKFYNINTAQVTQIESGVDPVVSGNVIVYRTSRWSGSLRYYLTDSGTIVDPGIADVAAFSIDGDAIAVSTYGGTIKVYEISKGKVTDTGLRGCSGSDVCWLDISGRIIVYERWEGGTVDANGIQIYPPEDLNGDGILGGECVAGWAKL